MLLSQFMVAAAGLEPKDLVVYTGERYSIDVTGCSALHVLIVRRSFFSHLYVLDWLEIPSTYKHDLWSKYFPPSEGLRMVRSQMQAAREMEAPEVRTPAPASLNTSTVCEVSELASRRQRSTLCFSRSCSV